MANAFPDRDAPEPSAAAIMNVLGAANGAWLELVDYLEAKGASVTWKWYRDGGWLARAAKGSKTLLWASIDDAGFVDGAVHFAARLREAVADFPGVPAAQAQRIRTAELWGKMVSVPFELRSKSDVKSIQAIVDAKITLK